MNAIIENLNHWGSRFTGFALPMLVQSCVLVAVLLVVDLLLRKWVRAVIRYALWMLVLVKLVLPPSLSLPTSLGYWLPNQPSKQTIVAASQVGSALVATEPAVRTLSSVPLVQPVAFLSEPHPALTWPAILLVAWLAVVLGLGVWVGLRCRLVVRLINQSTEAPSIVQGLLESCRQQLGLKQVIPIRCSSAAGSPAICGLLHPVIIIPPFLPQRLTESEMRSVLLHELAHFKRGDLWLSHAQTLLQVFYWYNPLLWLANAMIRRVREQAVDELVMVQMRGEAEAYPSTLLQVAKLMLTRPRASIGLVAILEPRSGLNRRIRHILDRPIPRTARIGIRGLLLVIMVAVMALPMACRREAEVPATIASEVAPQVVLDEVIRGQRLSEPQAQELEANLNKDPEEVSARFQLLGYYFMKQHASGSARKARQGHLLWLIQHHPETRALGTGYAGLDPRQDDIVFEQAKTIWFKHIKDNPKSIPILVNAANFFEQTDRATAENLMMRAQALDPKTPGFPAHLARLYSSDAKFGNPQAKIGASNKALAAMERAQVNTTNELNRFYNLDPLAQMAFDAGEVEKAATYANEMLRQTKQPQAGWSYGDQTHRGHLILGRIAVREGKLDAAKQHLLDAGRTTGSPVLGSFGPNMTLAKELLEKGEKETVLEYFKLCINFWQSGADKIETWTQQVNAGKMPEFGANLIY